MLAHTDPVAVRLEPPFIHQTKELPKCPAEESENCEKSPPTNAKKSCEKTDTRINRVVLKLQFLNKSNNGKFGYI